jgi:hypothetical protein
MGAPAERHRALPQRQLLEKTFYPTVLLRNHSVDGGSALCYWFHDMPDLAYDPRLGYIEPAIFQILGNWTPGAGPLSHRRAHARTCATTARVASQAQASPST